MGVSTQLMREANARLKKQILVDGGISMEQELNQLRAENQHLKQVLKDVGLFLHHCWCDVQMNDYSFERLNEQMDIIDKVLKNE